MERNLDELPERSAESQGVADISHTGAFPEPGHLETPDGADSLTSNTELSESAQRWNSLVFIVSNSIGYLVAPVFYVGVLHAAVLSSLDFGDTIANLPESVCMWMMPFPVLIAWCWPSTRHLRPMLVINYVCKGSAGITAAALFFMAPQWLAVGLVAHAAVIGVTNGVTNMCLWELIGRGMTPARRGWTLGITFGVGPIFAVLGSCASQLIVSGQFLDLIHITPFPKPWCHVVLFGVTGPAMAVAGAFVFLAHPPRENSAESKPSVAGVTDGLKQYFTSRLILIAIIGFLLTSAGGNMIMNNLALYVRDKMGELPEKYIGVQLVLRFGCKSLSGFTLGWMLARYQAKAPALATTLFCLAGVVWGLVVPGKWYLFSFSFLGAGELYYVYYINYIVGCSPPDRIRENTAYTNVMMVAVSFMPLIYGAISDTYGLKASFVLALGILVVAAAIVLTLLPRQPAQNDLVSKK